MTDADRLARLRILLFDVDGVFTDNGLWIDDAGRASKRFDIRDGAGLKLAREHGLEIGLISGHRSEAVRHRAEQLGIAICHVGVADKIPVFEAVLAEGGFAAEEALYAGDDLVDLPVLERVGFPATVADAHPDVKARCRLVTRAPGGHGAVREIVEHVLRGSGRWAGLAGRRP